MTKEYYVDTYYKSLKNFKVKPLSLEHKKMQMDLVSVIVQRLNDTIPSPWSDTLVVKRNEYLKWGDSKDTNLYYVEEGSVRIFMEDEKEEHTIRFGYEGSFIAALDSFISEQSSPFFIQAIKKSTVKVISKEDFMSFMQSSPDNLVLWQDIMGGLVCQQIEREIDLLTSSPLERYKRVLARSPRLFQEIPAKYIASYLRMTPETLSRLKS